jgi:hypothetical protein
MEVKRAVPTLKLSGFHRRVGELVIIFITGQRDRASGRSA